MSDLLPLSIHNLVSYKKETERIAKEDEARRRQEKKNFRIQRFRRYLGEIFMNRLDVESLIISHDEESGSSYVLLSDGLAISDRTTGREAVPAVKMGVECPLCGFINWETTTTTSYQEAASAVSDVVHNLKYIRCVHCKEKSDVFATRSAASEFEL